MIGKKARRFLNASATDSVPAVALDDFFRHEGLSSVYHVAIDTEGWDPLVLRGMANVLRAKRTCVISSRSETDIAPIWSGSGADLWVRLS